VCAPDAIAGCDSHRHRKRYANSSSLERIVSSREGAAAYRVSAVGGEAVEERLEAGFLGAGSPDPAA